MAASDGKYPHVYLFGAENRWNLVTGTNDMIEKKLNDVKEHCKTQLEKFAGELKKKIKEAIDKDGDI